MGPIPEKAHSEKLSGGAARLLMNVWGNMGWVFTLENGSPDCDNSCMCCRYIYTSWMNQGILPCVESGGHRRPHHHAELARDIFRSLEWVNGPDMRGTSLSKVARWLQTQIPSLSAEFRRSEPLTRIRDIAHRNDIPQDLKREIKHTLQNKLHRNAGPEDLVAAELMYDRIRKDEADLSEAFVCEFGVFLDELRDFFNAGNLSDSLQSIAQSLGGADDVGVQNIQQFLAGKKKLDMFRPNKAKPGEEITLVMDALHAVTTVRAYLTTRLSSGLRNDAPDAALAMRQTYRIAELRCEDYAFVLLGRFIGLTEERTSPSDLASAPDNSWALPIGALILGLRHLGMGGWEDMECFAIENELAMWHKLGRISVAENALRMKATLERLQRLISKISQDVVGLFAGRAGALGDALGVEPFMIQVFAESQIRASVLYQVSNLCTFLQHASREASGAGAWDAIVPGTATGRLMELERLDKGEIPVSTADHPLVLLIRSADGYEDVSGLTTARNGDSKKGGVSVSGIVLCQELPHLSHLGVRASQEHLVFASCIDETLLENEVKPLVGELVRLQVDSEGVTISEWRKDVSNGSQEPQPDNSSAAALNLQVSVDAYNAVATEDEMPSSVDRPDMQASVMRLAEATVHSCGAKASNCGILERLSMAKGAFHVPKGVCLPFEAMQLCLGADKSAHLDRLLKSLESEPALETVVGEIQRIIDECLPSDDILESIGKVFRAGTCVIVRSSSNMEDILGMTGAGLHDSIQNIDPSNPKTLSKAISDVWASLHTLRAVQARRAAGIPHSSAKMGVIIQEQLYPNMSFVLHTTEPVSRDASIIAAEMAPGLGETLASGVRGTPWRLAIGKATGSVVVKAFANFSHELQPQGMPGRGWESVGGADVGLVGRVVDYSRCSMSVDEERRAYVGRKLAEVSKVLEDNFGGQAQDVEGALNEDGTVYIVQTRPQPL